MGMHAVLEQESYFFRGTVYAGMSRITAGARNLAPSLT